MLAPGCKRKVKLASKKCKIVEDSLDNKDQLEKSTLSTQNQFDIDLIIKKVPGNNKTHRVVS